MTSYTSIAPEARAGCQCGSWALAGLEEGSVEGLRQLSATMTTYGVKTSEVSLWPGLVISFFWGISCWSLLGDSLLGVYDEAFNDDN